MIRDHVLADTVLGKVGANNASNKVGLDYLHDFDGNECGLNLHVQNHKNDIFPALISTPYFV